jgi:pimeloyl-ACP methyl ester carboxylesterase
MPIAADIYYHTYQERERLGVVLIHGAGGNHMYWPAEIRRLPGFHVYALDLPGHGKSPGRGQQSILAYTQIIIDWLDSIDLHSAAFIGHSMGGAIVQLLALEHPDRVVALGLVGTAARLRVASSILESLASETTFLNAVENIVACSFSPEANPALVSLAAKRMAETRSSVLYGDFLACDGFDTTEQVCDIQQPTLVVCGADDRMVPARYAQLLANSITGAQMETIPAAGHMVMLERPQAVASILARFLSGIYY